MPAALNPKPSKTSFGSGFWAQALRLGIEGLLASLLGLPRFHVVSGRGGMELKFTKQHHRSSYVLIETINANQRFCETC